MSTTITPNAIDAHVRVDYIRVVGRHRRDLGDIDKLAASIEEVGLLHPLTLARDGHLIAGQRRLEACRRLGWREVPVRFADNLDDAAKLLHAERDENTCRKDMLPSEFASLGAALRRLETEAARTRQGTRTDRGRELPGDVSGKFAGGDVRDAVGAALGISGRTYDYLHKAHSVANDPTLPEDERRLGREALEEMDETGAIWRPGLRLQRRLAAQRDAREAKEASAAPRHPEESVVASEDVVNDWIPAANDKTQTAVARRRALIREMAPRGYTSGQIGELLGILPQTVRGLAKGLGVQIVADNALGRSHKRIDSNRVVRETIRDLADAGTALDLIAYDDLDLEEIPGWVTSLTKSIRRLNQLNKRLKEMTNP